MIKKKTNNEDIFQDFFIAIKSSKGEFIIYESNPFKFSEIEMMNLIKICIVEARSKTIGRKLVSIYEDSTQERKELTKKRLNYIGIKKDEPPKKTITNNNSTCK